MRATIDIDDELLESARFLTGVKDTTVVVYMAMKSLVEREAARRLALLGGSQTELKAVPRRRPEAANRKAKRPPT